jgi:EmrB/QacA subfamily drug resistance transporter
VNRTVPSREPASAERSEVRGNAAVGNAPAAGDVPPGAWSVLCLVFAATVVIALSGGMLNIALPTIVEDLGGSAVQSTWVLVSYQLANTGLIVVMGQVADSLDRRRMFLTGLALFTGTSLLLGFSGSINVVIGIRALQGLAGAVLLANAAVLLASVFPVRLLNRAMGVYLSGFAAGQVLGPVLGGLIATWYGWPWLFWANVPLGVLAIVWGWRSLRHVPQRNRQPARLDLPGNVLVVVGIGGLLLSMSLASNRGWTDPLVIGGFAAFVVLFPLFLLVERRSSNPAVELTYFRHRPFALGMAGTFLVTMPRISVMVVVGLYFQGVHGDTALQAALKVTPMAIGLTVGALVADTLATWVDERVVVIGAAVANLVGLAVLIRAVDGAGHEVGILVGLSVLGVATGIFQPLNSSMVMRSASMVRAGSVNAVRVLVQSGGIALAVALAMTLVVSTVPPQAGRLFFSGDPEALTSGELVSIVTGHQLAFTVIGVLSALGLVACVANLWSPPAGAHERATRTKR